VQSKTIQLSKVTSRKNAFLDHSSDDDVVLEEPLSVILSSYTDALSIETTTVLTTMRTPGHDIELVKGWLNTQTFIKPEEIASMSQKENSNLLTISANVKYRLDKNKLTRLSAVSSSCGICNDTEIDKLVNQSKVNSIVKLQVEAQMIHKLTESIFDKASLFRCTGGSHSSALFTIHNGQLTSQLLSIREDVGRHNALDKLIGSFEFDSKEIRSSALLLSGRVSADLMQKVVCAGIPVVLAVGAPSSLAIEIAEALGIILIGFIRKDSFNIYSGNKQISINYSSA
jgi:FdhD protein